MSCPICGKPGSTAYRPFCSRRCADVDLARWLGGGYRIQTDEAPDPGAGVPPEEDGEDPTRH
ncbi:DNA gyrase inhibitor YacG [Wenxinia saemankumensis]|uniref:DNA gyrase inhibitor YacG n=1 Tax=Wenxinia saemankumensis TaxID=1447782 RepID=A0A1M6CMC8_9RHOB|nr:DNA gyrase inhibitor YacG [Wenxinia saemankumensis]SHI62167.1 hypothetical protein SAMN05444417_1266 [Wenxinia saemankumensis]